MFHCLSLFLHCLSLFLHCPFRSQYATPPLITARPQRLPHSTSMVLRNRTSPSRCQRVGGKRVLLLLLLLFCCPLFCTRVEQLFSIASR